MEGIVGGPNISKKKEKKNRFLKIKLNFFFKKKKKKEKKGGGGRKSREGTGMRWEWACG